MAAKPAIKSWQGVNASDPIITTATPPAAIYLLNEAVSWPLAVSTTPYCGCAHLCFTDSSPTATYTDTQNHDRFWGVPVAPGATHARLWIGRVFYNAPSGTQRLYGPSGHTSDKEYLYQHQSSTTHGGDSHPNISVGPAAIHATKVQTINKMRHKVYGGPKNSPAEIVSTGSEVDDSPSGPLSRQLELEALRRSKIEPFYVKWVSSVTAWVSRQDDDMGA